MNFKYFLLALTVVVADSMIGSSCVFAQEAAAPDQPVVDSKQSDAFSNDAPSDDQNTKQKHKQKKAASLKASEIFDPNMPDESTYVAASTLKAPLEGSATYINVTGKFGQTIHGLTKMALDKNPNYQKTSEAVDHFRTKFQRALRVTKDAINYAYPYRGFSMSMEGSRVILDKDQKLSNLWIAELQKQRYWDEMRPKITTQVMQISMGLGMEKSEQADKVIQTGVDGLTELVGQDAAQSTYEELKEWSSQINVPDPVFQQAPWDVSTTERIYKAAQQTSADGDPLISYIFGKVKKFDHSKLFNFTASVVEANLSALTVLSGNPCISLASEAANTAFVMTTGGPEENKILKELYYGRRLEIRRKRITEETELALTNYQKALLTHNAPQLAMSEVVMSELIGPEKIATVLERDPINDFTVAAPIELAKQEKQ